MPAELDPFAGSKEVTPGKFTFGKIGDYIIGYFNSVKEIDTQNGRSKLYEIKATNGQYHNSVTSFDANGNKQVKVDEEATVLETGAFYPVWGKKVSDPGQLDNFFHNIKFGQKIGVQLKELKPSKTAGYSPLKIYKTNVFPEIDPESPEAMIKEAGMLAPDEQ